MKFPIRINKYLAETGKASRREADSLIQKGVVSINGKRAVLGQMVQEDDEVTLTGDTKDKKYLAYYKGRGVLTMETPENKNDISAQLKERGVSDVYPVGRLDKDSEGLMILTNDGRITKPLLDPEYAHEKEYVVTVDKKINDSFLKKLAEGVDIEGYHTKKAIAKRIKENDTVFSLTLTEGKKHQIRRMCAALGYQIKALKRVRIMNIKLGALKPNQFRNIRGEERKEFLTSLGISNR